MATVEKPTIFRGTNDMRIFQEEIFGPVLAVARFKDEREALQTKCLPVSCDKNALGFF